MMKLIYIPEHFQEHEQSLKQIDHFSLVQVHDIEECKLQIHPLNQDVILFNRSFLDIANITVFSQELKQVSSAVKIVVFDQTPDRGQAFENIEYIDLVIEQLEPGAVLYDQLIGLENEDKTVLINKKDLVAGLNGNEGLIIDETQEINFSLGDDRVEAEELTLKTSPNLEQVNQDEEELGLHLLLENNEEEALEITETFIKPEGLEHNDEATLIVPSASGEESSFEQVDASAEIDFIEMPLDLDEKFSSELDSISQNIIIAEKSTSRLFLYTTQENKLKLLETIPMATGKVIGDKTKQGDLKTPEGIYFFSEFLSRDVLEKRIPSSKIHLYGKGAFTSDYPNPIDRLRKKTGGGIWLHSSDNEERIDNKRETRGCTIVKEDKLFLLKKHIDFHRTPFIVVKDLQYIDLLTQESELKNLRSALDNWSSKQTQYQLSPSSTQYLQAKDYALIQVLAKKNNEQGLINIYLVSDSKYQWKVYQAQWTNLPKQSNIQ